MSNKEAHKAEMLKRRFRQDLRKGSKIDTTSKYSGAKLREIRAVKGVGRPL